ncbi:MAG: GNAT family N-acetyltransferase [Planctomycetota bacterium]|jgi:RimJ/RimL family protein N-acetyltransferase
MSQYCLTTDRVGLRAPVLKDMELLLELDSDPEVLRFVGGKSVERESLVNEIMPRWLGYDVASARIGYWVAEELETGEFMGWFHLRPPRYDRMPDYEQIDGELEIGYRIRREFWNMGFSTEVSRELLRLSFEHHRSPRVIAIAEPGNVASFRVMEKVGMVDAGTTMLSGLGIVGIRAIEA